jgi:hypothetical protein
MSESNRMYYIAAAGNLGPIGGPNSWTHLESVNIGTGVASGVFTIYDGQSASGTVVAVIDATAARYHEFDAVCKNGIFCVLSGGNAKVTVTAGG